MGALIDLNGLGHYKSKENAMVASVYSATKTYAVGDYVYYNGTLYRCTTAITTAEAWTAGHWTAAKIGDDVTELKTAIILNEYEVPITSWQNGYYDTSQQKIISNSTYATCEPIDYFDGYIYIPDTYAYKIFSYYNSAYSVFIKSNTWISGGVTIQIPKGTAFFVSVKNANGTNIDSSTVNITLTKRLEQLEADYNYKAICTGIVNGKYITSASSRSLTPTNSNDFAYLELTVERGELYLINTTFSGTNVVGLCLVNGSNIIDYYDSTLTSPVLNNQLYQCSSDGTLLVCGRNTYELNVWKLEKKNGKNVIDCYGDSLTLGSGDSDNGYPPKLQTLLGSNYVVNKYASGGNGVNTIACRMGALQMIVPPMTIPASGATSSFAIKDFEDKNVVPFNDGGTHKPSDWELCPINPCVIDGIAGTIAINDGDDQYTFTRADAGKAKDVTSKTAIETPQIVNDNENICILWGGTNNTWQGIDFIDRYLGYMVEKAKSGRYIVIGLTAKNIFSNIDTMNATMAAKFGVHFLDIRDYLLNYGLSDASITPTAEDEAAIENGEIPPSLLYDATHFNSTGYTLIANQVYAKGKSLGYWI